MADVICDTSPLQYLHQLGCLAFLPALAERVVVPKAVVEELRAGRSAGVSLPDVAALPWVAVASPRSLPDGLRSVALGPGEAEVLALGLASPDAVLVLDDRLARRVADTLGLKYTGTLGLLLDAKRAGLVPVICPLLDRLESLGFRLAPHTRAAVLGLAGE